MNKLNEELRLGTIFILLMLPVIIYLEGFTIKIIYLLLGGVISGLLVFGAVWVYLKIFNDNE